MRLSVPPRTTFRVRLLGAAALLSLLMALFWLPRPTPPAPAKRPAPAPRAIASTASPSRFLEPASAPLEEEEEEGEALEAPEPAEDTGQEADNTDVPLYAIVRAHIRNPDGSPVVGGLLTSHDCALWGWTDAEGMAEAVVMGVERCTVQGRRPDGLLWGRSEWWEIAVIPGEVAEIELIVPEERTGGLGVLIRAHEEGMVVERVWPGTPAEQMGLTAGDVITEVDGLPTATLTVDEFVEVMTGPEGTDIAFALAYEADTGWVEEPIILTRARIEDR